MELSRRIDKVLIVSSDAARKVITSLKDALEDKEVSIGKIADSVGYHGNFTFVLIPAVLD